MLRDENDDDSDTSDHLQFKQYVADGVIQGGMIPKLEEFFEALNAGVTEVVITLASAINENNEPASKIIQKVVINCNFSALT